LKGCSALGGDSAGPTERRRRKNHVEDLVATGREGNKITTGLKKLIMTVKYIQLILDVKVCNTGFLKKINFKTTLCRRSGIYCHLNNCQLFRPNHAPQGQFIPHIHGNSMRIYF
jgi:hypothetical protein